MLDSLRRHATGWLAKVLFAILILSFAIWGIGDVLRSHGSSTSLARVAGIDITQAEVVSEFDNQLRQLQQQYGQQLDKRAAVSLGLLNQALESNVARRLVDAHARALDLTIDDATLADTIRQDPGFQSSGGFDRARFEMFLRSIGMNEQGYVAALRNDMVRRAIIDSLTTNLHVPETLAKKLVDYRQERRRGSALVVEAAAIAVDAPGDEVLEAYLKDHEDSYAAPEYRSITLLTLQPDDLVGEIEVPEADLRAAYDARLESYRKPEQRQIEQLLASDEATIRKAAELVAGGQSFTQAAAALKGNGVERSEVGPLARGDLPGPLDASAWALAQGQVSEPLQSPFGWHLLRLAKVEPERTQPFAQVKDELRRELAAEKATAQLPAIAGRLDDELAAGTALEDAATKLGVEIEKVEKVDRTGHTAAKERLAADRLTPEILQAAFLAKAGETSLLEQTGDGYYMFRIDAVEPSQPRPLAEVRAEVEAAWRKEEQAKRAKARADELKGQATSPAALATLAGQGGGLRLVAVGPVTRDADGSADGLSAGVIAALFATKPGEVAAQVTEVPDGPAIVATEEVLPAQVEATLVDATEAAVLSSLRNETVGGYEAALRQRFPVSIDQTALGRLMEAQAQ